MNIIENILKCTCGRQIAYTIAYETINLIFWPYTLRINADMYICIRRTLHYPVHTHVDKFVWDHQGMRSSAVGSGCELCGLLRGSSAHWHLLGLGCWDGSPWHVAGPGLCLLCPGDPGPTVCQQSLSWSVLSLSHFFPLLQAIVFIIAIALTNWEKESRKVW